MADNPKEDVIADATAAGDGEKQLVFQKIYLKDSSLESPNSPAVFTVQRWQPKVNMNFGTKSQDLGQDLWEVVLTVTIEAKMEENTAYLCEIQQAGIFLVKGFSEEERRRLLIGYCPTLIFPYARETVSDLVNRGGFPQLLLQPVNFELLYMKHAQEMQQAQTEAPDADERH